MLCKIKGKSHAYVLIQGFLNVYMTLAKCRARENSKCGSDGDRIPNCELNTMSAPTEKKEKEDPVKMHKEASNLLDRGEFKEAREIFHRTAELYHKAQNYFDSSSMNYKAGEAAFAVKDFEGAVEDFMKSAELSFLKGFDRFGVSALEYAKDAYNALGNKEKIKELEKKIKEVKKKLEESF